MVADHDVSDTPGTEFATYGDVRVVLTDDFVAMVEIRRPPHNFFDVSLIASLADAFEALDADPGCRAISLCSEGKNFCAGAQLGDQGERFSEVAVGSGNGAGASRPPEHLYDHAVRLFATHKPVVAAIQGAAIGGGLGLALMPDFRVASAESTFSANFARLGFHHGFGLSVTLPDLVGPQAAMDLLYTGRRVRGEEAFALGLCDRLVPKDEIREGAHAWAQEIAGSAPLAVEAIRETLRGSLAGRIREATDREKAVQNDLQRTEDFKEGVRAMAERRAPRFEGR